MASAIATSVNTSSIPRLPSPSSHHPLDGEAGKELSHNSQKQQTKNERPPTFLMPPPQISAPAASTVPAVTPSSSINEQMSCRSTSDQQQTHLRRDDDDDLGSSDEVKVFKDEGEEEKEFISPEEIQAALLEDKSSLIQETELAIKEEYAARLEHQHQLRHHQGKAQIDTK